MKEAKLAVMNQVEDWNDMYSQGYEYVTTMKNGFSVFCREKVTKSKAKPKAKK